MLKSVLMRRFANDAFVGHLRMPLYRNGYALLFSGIASAGLGMLYWLIAARLYPAEVVGASSAAISAMMLLSGIAQFSLNNVFLRFIPRAGRATTKLVVVSYVVSIAASLLLTAFFCAKLEEWSPAMRFMVNSPQTTLFFTLSSAAWTIFTIQDSALTGLRQTLWVPLENIVTAIAKIGLLFAFLPFWGDYGIFLAWSAPVILSLLPINYLIFVRAIPRHIQQRPNSSESLSFGAICRYMVSTYIGSLFTLASTTLLPIIVANQAGAAANAFFYIPWMLSTGLRLVALNLGASLIVEAVHDEKKLALYSYRILVQNLRLLLPVVAVIMLGASWLLQIFGQEYANEGTTLLRLLALSALPNILVMLYLSLARVQDQIWELIWVQGALSVLLLVLSYLLLPRYSIVGVGLASLISQTAIALLILYLQLGATLKHGRAASLQPQRA
jgi:O-antigen/teichoic acid export membrane protein